LINIGDNQEVKRGFFSPAPCSPAPLLTNTKNETALPLKGGVLRPCFLVKHGEKKLTE